jgi:hypothetical protein
MGIFHSTGIHDDSSRYTGESFQRGTLERFSGEQPESGSTRENVQRGDIPDRLWRDQTLWIDFSKN